MSENQSESLKKYRLDIIVIASILALSLILLLAVFLSRKEGAVVTVEIDGQLIAEYPLDKNGVFSLNEGTNVLVIENGAAYFSYSSCPDHVCENTGKVRFVGETIICLPNLITVTVTGSSSDAVDLVS